MTALCPTREAVITAVVEELEGRLHDGLEYAERVADRLRLETDTPAPAKPDVGFYDLRHEQRLDHPKTKRHLGRTVVRDPNRIDAIVIHQTAVEYGVSDRQVRLSGGDRELAMARRALGVACHAMAFRDGFYVAAHPLRHYVHHGNGFNARSLGLEIDGRYAGLRDDPDTAAREDLRTTWRGDPTTLTDRTVDAACAALRWLVEEGRREGMPIQWIYAHRQSSATRRSDPGQEIWERVVLAYAVPVLGLRTDVDLKVGDGAPIPREWDPDGHVRY